MSTKKKGTNLRIGGKMYRNLEEMDPMQVHALAQKVASEYVRLMKSTANNQKDATIITNQINDLVRQKKILDRFVQQKAVVVADAAASDLKANAEKANGQPPTTTTPEAVADELPG